MRASWWMVAGLLVGLVGCRQTELEACEEFAETSCECGTDPYGGWETKELEEQHACDGVDNLDSRCSLASEEDTIEGDWACVLRKYKKSCDYDAAIDACDYSEE